MPGFGESTVKKLCHELFLFIFKVQRFVIFTTKFAGVQQIIFRLVDPFVFVMESATLFKIV